MVETALSQARIKHTMLAQRRSKDSTTTQLRSIPARVCMEALLVRRGMNAPWDLRGQRQVTSINSNTHLARRASS